jgi:hypothetical protein
MWPFKRKPIVDAEPPRGMRTISRGSFDSSTGAELSPKTKLVLPKPGFFVFDGERWRAQEIRAAVRARQTPTGETATHP